MKESKNIQYNNILDSLKTLKTDISTDISIGASLGKDVSSIRIELKLLDKINDLVEITRDISGDITEEITKEFSTVTVETEETVDETEPTIPEFESIEENETLVRIPFENNPEDETLEDTCSIKAIPEDVTEMEDINDDYFPTDIEPEINDNEAELTEDEKAINNVMKIAENITEMVQIAKREDISITEEIPVVKDNSISEEPFIPEDKDISFETNVEVEEENIENEEIIPSFEANNQETETESETLVEDETETLSEEKDIKEVEDNTINSLSNIMCDYEDNNAAFEEKKEVTYKDTITVKKDVVKQSTFEEEKSKKSNEFLYSFYKIQVMHVDKFGKGIPEMMLAEIIPLEICNEPRISVPIMVTLVHGNKYKCFSSYDTLDTQHNLIQADIDDFHFFCRGYYDENGNFASSISLTGQSYKNNDKMEILKKFDFGNDNKDRKNGHIKFSYESEAGVGTIEVVPFGFAGDPDFLAIIKNNEFINYYLKSKTLKIYSNIEIYTPDGTVKEIQCNWIGEEPNLVLQAEIV